MLEIIIPKDIREYETKFIGPFTMRQSFCFVAMLIILWLNSTFQKNVLGMETTTYIPGLIFCTIPILFGWGKSFLGMEFEHYLKTVFISTYRKPKYRAFKTHNYHLITIDKINKEDPDYQDSKINKKKKKESVPRKMPYELQAFA